MQWRRMGVTVGVFLCLAAVGCSKESSAGGSSGTGESTVEVQMHNFDFEPATLEGAAGDQLTLELTNEGAAEHNFTLEDQNVDQDVEPGEEASVKVTIPEAGSLQFYCKYHKDLGMTGTLRAS